MSKYLTKKSEKSLQWVLGLRHWFNYRALFTFAVLRNFLVIALSLAYLMVTTEFHEILRIPTLLEHYQEHTKKSKQLSFLDFISEHYFQSEIDSDANENHKSLPFNHDDLHIPVLWVEELIRPEVVFKLQIAIADNSKPINEDFYSEREVTDIWQPPRC